MIKKLPQRSAAVGSPRLLPVYGVQRLVDEKATRTGDVRPQRSLGHNTRKARLTHMRDCGWLICLISMFHWWEALGEKIQVLHQEKHPETI